jgi:dipeptidyl aminopeptidase/acylaminoacyl peptidase
MEKGKKRGRRKARGARRPRRRVTADDLLRFHLVADPQIAPDGSAIVFVRKHIDRNEYVSNLWIVGAGRGEPRQFTGGGRDSRPRWSPDGRRLAFIGGRDRHRPQVHVIPAPGAGGGEAAALTSFPPGSIKCCRWSPDGKLIAVSFREDDPAWSEEAKKAREAKNLSPPPRVIDDWWYRLDGDGYFETRRHRLYLVDAATGEHRLAFARDTLGGFSFDFSPDGRELAIAANSARRALVEPWKEEILRLEVATGKLTRVPDLPVGPKSAVAWSPDGRHLAYASRIGKDGAYSAENLELFVCDARRGGARSLTAGADVCLLAATLSDMAEASFAASFAWHPDSRRLLACIGRRGERHIASVPLRGSKLSFLTRGPRQHDLGNLSADGKLAALTVASATRLAEVHVGVVGRRSLRMRRRSDCNGPILSELEISEPQSHWVRSTGGARVQVWSMRPPGLRRGRRVPAVLEVHGGPHAQYGLSFFHEFQLLAARGYAVFFSNPRGSKGYGQKHCEAIRGKWGEADWDDIQAVTDFLARLPFVDRKRLGIMGGSYGGYMTNWAVSHTDAFRAAITDRCVSNLVSMFGTTDLPEEPDRYWEGNAWDRPEELWRQSPLKYFGSVRTPVLIIHSEGDLRCSIEQAEQVFTALKLRRVPVRLVRYPASTSHGLSRNGPPDLRLHRLEQILAWWKKHLGAPRR